MRCEGWTRHGGAFTLGPVTWSQCKNDADLILVVEQEGKVTEQPSCDSCYEFGKKYGIKIIETKPMKYKNSVY